MAVATNPSPWIELRDAGSKALKGGLWAVATLAQLRAVNELAWGVGGTTALAAMALGTGLALAVSVQVAWSRDKAKVALPQANGHRDVPRRGPFKFPNGWRLAAKVLVVFTLLVPGVVALAQRLRAAQNRETILVLVADFGGPSPDEHRVTETIFEQLRSVLANYTNARVTRLHRSFTEPDVARSLGLRRGASFVVWGWYGLGSETVPVGAHIEVMPGGAERSSLPRRADTNLRFEPRKSLEDFSLQINLAKEVAEVALSLEGLIASRKGEWSEAARAFSQAIDQTTGSTLPANRAAMLTNRALALRFNGMRDRARVDLDEALALDPLNKFALQQRAVLRTGQGDYSGAIVDLDRAITLGNADASLFFSRAHCYSVQGDFKKALEDCNRGLGLEPAADVGYLARADIYNQMGDWARALDDYKRAARLSPNQHAFTASLAFNGAGVVYAETKDYREAVAWFSQAIHAEPRWAAPYLNRGHAYRLLGSVGLALADLDKSLELRPNHAASLCEKGLAHLAAGNLPAAAAEFDKAVQMNPDDDYVYRARGRFRFWLTDFLGGMEDMTRADQIASQPGYARPRDIEYGLMEWRESWTGPGEVRTYKP